MIPGLGQAPPLRYHTNPNSFYGKLIGLGLTGNLKTCLDAGDINSYDPTKQTIRWLDTAGGGYDFFRGGTASSESSDPTFHGTPGNLSSNEYWSLDGGDYFTYDGANAPWIEMLHKDGAIFSFCGMFMVSSADLTHGLFGTVGASGSGTGIDFHLYCQYSTHLLYFRCFNNGNTVLSRAHNTMGYGGGQWYFFGLSVNEPAGTGFFWAPGIGGQPDNFTSTYNSPSSNNASYPMQIGARGNGQTPMAGTGRIALAAFWQGTALTSAQMSSIWSAISPRFT